MEAILMALVGRANGFGELARLIGLPAAFGFGEARREDGCCLTWKTKVLFAANLAH
jgi:hypothetical protein